MAFLLCRYINIPLMVQNAKMSRIWALYDIMRKWHNAKQEKRKSRQRICGIASCAWEKFPKNKFSENSVNCVWKWVQFTEFSEYSDNSTKMSKLSDNLQDARKQVITYHLLCYYGCQKRKIAKIENCIYNLIIYQKIWNVGKYQ